MHLITQKTLQMLLCLTNRLLLLNKLQAFPLVLGIRGKEQCTTFLAYICQLARLKFVGLDGS